jgi:energy-coupling factor transporter ATP-binding protein EcfA2
VVERPRVHFRRPHGLLPLPLPSRDGSIELLRPYVNVSDAGFTLLVAWLTAALRPVGPYPVLVLTGEQGSAKSTLARILRLLIDPHSCPLLVEPRSTRDLMVTASNGWLLAYDNLSAIPTWLSDCLCQLVYGGGLSSRELFTNEERSTIYAQRPVVLNGIDDFVRRGDLRDRCVLLELSPISRARRRSEDELSRAFDADYPRILGGVLDALAGALRALPLIQLPALPRMADHARWGEAIGRALGWKPMQFMFAYDSNLSEASMEMLQDSAAGLALLGMAARFAGGWSGTPTELHVLVTNAVGRAVATSAHWPKTPRHFSREIRGLLPQLRMHGLEIEFQRGKSGRVVTVTADPGATLVR